MDKAYGATADETNPFSKAELGEAHDAKPVLAPVFVQPLRSRAKRRRRSGGLLLAAVLAVVVTASKLAQHGPRAQLERVAKAVAPASAARASNRGRSPVRPEAADTEAPASVERAANRGRSPVRPSVEEEDQARRNLRIFLNERMSGAKTQRDGVAPHRHLDHVTARDDSDALRVFCSRRSFFAALRAAFSSGVNLDAFGFVEAASTSDIAPIAYGNR